MNKTQAKALGMQSGVDAAKFGDFTPQELADADLFRAACSEICSNKRQYAEDPTYTIAQQPNAESLFEAYEEGEAIGIERGARIRGIIKPEDKVIFRKFREGGNIVALFPEYAGSTDLQTCMSYMHIGQHSAASIGLLTSRNTTRPAKPEEYADLLNELKQIGYNPKPITEVPRGAWSKRFAEVNRKKAAV